MSKDQSGQWIETCGCGRETRVKNLRYRTHVPKTAQPCDTPHPHSAQDEDDVPSVPTEAGWCGCGSPEAVDEMMLAYLRARVGHDFPRPEPTDATILLAYIADDLGWTEHGTSIGGDWLTEDGEAALAELERRARVPA